jgi:hypothetical protein
MNPNTVATVVAVCAAIGLLWPAVQAFFQRPNTNPMVKTVTTIVASIIFGAAGYIAINGLPDLHDIPGIFVFAAGVYGAIMVFYQGLKKGVYDQIEARFGPKEKDDAEEPDAYDYQQDESGVYDPESDQAPALPDQVLLPPNPYPGGVPGEPVDPDAPIEQ